MEEDFKSFVSSCITNHFVVECPYEYKKQYEIELEIIRQNNFEQYFLQAIWILNISRKKFGNFPFITRGSSGSSIVSWLCGLSAINPVLNDFRYSRFINSFRSDNLPDIDIDVPSVLRNKIFDYLFQILPNFAYRISNHVFF